MNLLGGDLDLRQFAVLDQARIVRPRLQVRAGILGASHVLQLGLDGKRRVHEVFACTDVVADGPRVFSGKVSEIRSALELELCPGVLYRFRPWLSGWRAGLMELQSLEARATRAQGRAHEIGLCHAFPCSGPGRGLPGTLGAPKTVVWVRLEPSGLAVDVETAHSYPNEETIVFSSTRVSLEVRAEVQP